MGLTHFDEAGNARMVDVSAKEITCRTAVAEGVIRVSETVFKAVADGAVEKGDVLSVAQVAGIMGCKRTPELIPLCHPLTLTNAAVRFTLCPETYEIKAVCSVKTAERTGVEMEALTGVSAALLTIYDMCKALDKRMEIRSIRLAEKHGGKSGDFYFSEKGEKK